MCFDELDVDSDVLRKALEAVGVNVRRGAPVKAVYGLDRDILAALRADDRPVLGVSPPGVKSSLAVADLKSLPILLNYGDCTVVEVPRLVASIGGATLIAVNEVAIFPSRSATLMEYVIYVGGNVAITDIADGVLIATPLGSTAYAYSAGGPIIAHGAKVLEILPVNSLFGKRALIVSDEETIKVTRIRSRVPVEAIADGAARVEVRGDVTVRKGPPARLVRAARGHREPMPSNVKLPPSARYVYSIVAERGPLTMGEIAELSGLPRRTVRHALKMLVERGLIEAYLDPLDTRRRIYKAVQ